MESETRSIQFIEKYDIFDISKLPLRMGYGQPPVQVDAASLLFKFAVRVDCSSLLSMYICMLSMYICMLSKVVDQVCSYFRVLSFLFCT